jgi:catechol 2,3-dioxygenase-like lactoylglutathione lyase family enzyme
MTVPARISIVTIGVADVARSAAFYERLGWERCASSMDEIVWFRTADSYLGIFSWQDLVEDTTSTSRLVARSAA